MPERLEDRTVPSGVTGLSITSGPAAGGTLLQVNGSGFTGATAVSFGGAAAASFTVLSDTAIGVTDPSHAAGTVDVIVTAPSGTSSAAYYDLFTYNAPPPPPPAVTGLSATTGPTTGGGGTVDIFGSGFTGANVVSFGGAEVSYYSFTVVNDGEIALTPPAHAAGTVDVTVTTEYGTSADVMADLYTYVAPPTPPPPAVTGLSITSGPTAGGGGTVDVFGSGFTGANVVSFGGAEVSYYSFTVVNDGEIALAQPPAHAAGTVDVTVTTEYGTSADVMADEYTYVAPPPPAVTGVSPATGSTAGGGGTVDIFGSGFTGAWSVSFGGAEVSYYSFTVVNDGEIALAPPPATAAGTVDVTVTTEYGTSADVMADQYTYVAPPTPPPPAVTGLSITSGPTGGGGTVDVFGSGFTGANVVSFGGAGVSYYSFTVVNDGEIALAPPAHAAGTVDVTVTTDDGTSADVMADLYTYVAPPPPAVTGVSPATGPTAGGGGTVDIFGSGFTGANVVSFGGAEVSYYSFTVVNDGEIALTPPAHAAGTVDVTVTTEYGTSADVMADLYTYVAPPPPAVTAVSPPSGSTAGGAYVEIDGSGFTGADGVSFGSVASYLFSLVNDNVIDAYAPAQAAGTVDVTVNTANGTSAASAADRFTYLATTTTTLASSADPSTFGQSITLTATVSDGGQGTPTGTVEFDDSGNIIGTGTLSSGGQATFVTSSLTVGDHSLSATYYGDSANAGSTSGVVNQTVQQASTTTTLTSSANPSDIGQAVTFTAKVDGASGGAPTGTITFLSGTTVLGTGTLSPGGNGSQATLTLSTLPTGTDPVIAVYGGDPNYGGSSSPTLNQVVENNGAFVWTGAVSEDWDVAGNWLVNGMVPQDAPACRASRPKTPT